MLTPDLANKADGKPDIITEHAQWRSLSAGHFVPPGLDYVIGLQGQSYPTEEALWTEREDRVSDTSASSWPSLPVSSSSFLPPA